MDLWRWYFHWGNSYEVFTQHQISDTHSHSSFFCYHLMENGLIKSLEHIFSSSWRLWIWFSLHGHAGSSSQVWAGCLEGSVYSFNVHITRCWGRCTFNLESTVCIIFFGHFSQPWWQNRYHQVPTFGWDTIRKFSNNALEMKKLAARDFEDLIQVCCSVSWGEV